MNERYHSIVYPLVGTHHFMRYPTLLVFEIFSAVLHPEHLRRDPKNRKALPWAQKSYITIKVGRRNPPRDPLHVVSSAPRRPPWEVPNLRLSPARWTSTHLWKGGQGNLNLGVILKFDVWEKSSFQGLSDLCYKSFWSPSCHSISWAGLEGTQEPLSQRTFWNQSSLSVSAEQHRCSLFYHYNWKEFESSHLLQELKTRKFLLPCWEWNLDVLYTLAHLACWI